MQGVGAKVALGLLSALSPRDLVAAIAAGDRASLTRAPGVGAKLAVRLLSELREQGRRHADRSGLPMPVAARPGWRRMRCPRWPTSATAGSRRIRWCCGCANASATAPRWTVLRDSLKELAR